MNRNLGDDYMQDAMERSEIAAETMKLQKLCEEFGCPVGIRRLDWLRVELNRLKELENAVSLRAD